MGLDWNPMARPKAGFEAEYQSILSLDLDSLDEPEQQKYIARFHEISEAAYETLDAPRVGKDTRANEWLVEQVHASGKLEGLSAAEVEDLIAEEFEDNEGYHVLTLLPPSPGLPVYVPFGDYEGVDRYTFRAKFLDAVSDLLGEELHERAWRRMSPDELNEYGETLLAIGRDYARLHACEALEEQRDPPDTDDEDSPEARAHILFSAGKWCVFWAQRGHGLDPYF